MSDKYSEKRHLLSSFLIQVETYIQFNRKMFNTETEKVIFTAAAHLQSDTLNWFKLTLNNHFTNKIFEQKDIMNEIFTDFQVFKAKIKVIFEMNNKKCTTEREISLLW